MSAPIRGDTVEKYKHKIVTINETKYTDQATDKAFSAVELVFPDWVQVVCITKNGTLILVDQFRFGNRTFTTELPGGAVDEGENPLVAGVRELLEETGYAGNAKLIQKLPANPATQNNDIYTVLVTDAYRAGERRLDDNERIELSGILWKEWKDAWAKGTIKHPYMLVALHAVEDYLNTGRLFNVEACSDVYRSSEA